MKHFALLVLLGVSMCLCAEECLDYDDKSSLSYLSSKQFSQDLNFARVHMVETMRDYGFGVCLRYFDLDSRKEDEMNYFQEHLRNIESRAWKDDRCITTDKGKRIKEEVENYVIDYRRKSVESYRNIVTEARLKEMLETPPLLAWCLSFYVSKEYHDEIERIVKKHCKDCK